MCAVIYWPISGRFIQTKAINRTIAHNTNKNKTNSILYKYIQIVYIEVKAIYVI